MQEGMRLVHLPLLTQMDSIMNGAKGKTPKRKKFASEGGGQFKQNKKIKQRKMKQEKLERFLFSGSYYSEFMFRMGHLHAPGKV